MTRISVIIPIHNSGRYLANTLNNYMKQNCKDIEFILVDDGSQDDSLRICKEYEKRNANIKVMSQFNRGVSAARNLGLGLASGEYVAFLDSDDYIDSEMFSSMLKIAEDESSDFVSCGISMELEKKDGNRIKQYELKYGNETITFDNIGMKKNMVNIWEKGVPYNVVNKLYKKRIISDNNILFSDLHMGEDLEFNMQILHHCKRVSMCPNSFYHYIREREGAATVKYIENWYEIRCRENQNIKRFFYKYFDETPPLEAKEYISRRFVNRALGCMENELRDGRKGKRSEITNIIKSKEFRDALSIGKNYSLITKILILPMKCNMYIISYFLIWVISKIKQVMPRVFEFFKYRR